MYGLFYSHYRLVWIFLFLCFVSICLFSLSIQDFHLLVLQVGTLYDPGVYIPSNSINEGFDYSMFIKDLESGFAQSLQSVSKSEISPRVGTIPPVPSMDPRLELLIYVSIYIALCTLYGHFLYPLKFD